MSHRITVLSRRLQRFAIGVSCATVAFVLIGLFAAARNERQLVFLFAGLAAVCLFATLFLWLAHGFAWAMIPEEPAEATKPAEPLKPAEPPKPAELMKAAEPLKPAEVMKPAEAMKATEVAKPAEPLKPAEAMKPAEPLKPAEVAKPTEATKPAEPLKPAEVMKSAEAKKPSEPIKPAKEKVIVPKDPPDAKYTITGRRIS